MFSRAQKAHWLPGDYEVKRSGVSGSTSASASAIYRFPKKGTALERQMLAATPRVFVEGYRLALEKAIPDRTGALVLFWGMSTGGASLYPLAKYYTPDGYLGWGTSSTGLAYVNNRMRDANTNDIYERSALRVRERGLDDFTYYTKDLDTPGGAGTVQFKDGRTDRQVTLQNSEVTPISGDEYRRNINAR